MRFYNQKHKFYCGIDLHARFMYLCIMNQDGDILLHKNIKANPEIFLKVVKPYLDDLVVAVECIFTWYWIADLCHKEKIAFVLGHALYMKAIHGTKTKNDKIDSQKIAVLLRGGMIPMSYVYPQEMRATRDLLRRRTHLMRKRSELLSHIQNTNSQYNLPDFGKKLAYKTNRIGVEEHFEDPSIRKNIQLDLALLDTYDQELTKVEYFINKNAKIHDLSTYYLLRSIPGIGKILTLTILYEIHTIHRFEKVQQFSSYARLIRPAKESNGKKVGSANSKMGNHHLKWAFSEAACLFLRGSEKRQKYFKRIESKHGKAKALSILAHKLGRTAYYILKTGKPFDMDKFLNA
ncbi:MAG: IS110 family transposase [Desulfobacterales bacterium]|nr:IS110 family transposase [Desulfobacterales bacterium]